MTMKQIKIAIILLILIGVSLCSFVETEKSTSHANNPKLQEQMITNSTIEGFEKKLQDRNSKNVWAILIACGFGLINMIIAIAALKKLSKYRTRMDHHRSNIEQLESQLNEIRSSINSKISELSRKVHSLESRPASKEPSNPSPKHTERPPLPVQTISKTGYFGATISGENGKGYFKKLLPIKNEEARFSAEIISETKAKFKPIVTLSNIKSHDYMNLAIDFQGVSTFEAKDMDIRQPGIAEKNGEKWIITEKVLIELKK